MESMIRLGCFLGVLILCGLAQSLWPRRQLGAGWRRVAVNLAMPVLGSALLKLSLPFLAVGIAIQAGQNGWGLLNLWPLPIWVDMLVALLMLDMIIYWQHRLFHRIPLLWRLHRMHHSDTHIDVTTGLRFHPLEILLSMLIKLGAVLALGASPWAVLMFEVILNAGSLFNHSNLRLSLSLDRMLRWIVVTPDMHRVHHSWYVHETNSNYGFSFSCWDRLFRSYVAQPKEGHLGMTIGLRDFRAADEQRLLSLLWQPLRPQSRNPASFPSAGV